MAVSKRLRYEILRRDNHSCRYCGACAPDARLTVDHVVPTALGGGDDPANLVTACSECNSGKSASNPEATMVAEVSQDALRWRAAILQAQAAGMADVERREAFRAAFCDLWSDWTCPDYSYQPAPGEERRRVPFDLPNDWGIRVEEFYGTGITPKDMERAIESGMTGWKVKDTFAYCLGVLKRVQQGRADIARALLDQRQSD